MASELRRLISFLITAFAGLLFAVELRPGLGTVGCLGFGSFLFLTTSILFGVPGQIRSAVRTATVATWASVVGICGAIVLAIILFARWLYPAEMPLDFQRCETIIRMVEGGQLGENAAGTVELPSELADATYDRVVHVTHLPTGRLYLFETMSTRLWAHWDFRGYVYTMIPFEQLPTHTIEGATFLSANAHSGFPSNVVLEPTSAKGWLRAYPITEHIAIGIPTAI